MSSGYSLSSGPTGTPGTVILHTRIFAIFLCLLPVPSQARAVFPTAMVNISGVTTGCPCEDGPDCTDQVRVVTWQSEMSRGLIRERMSLIESFPQCASGPERPVD